MNLSDKGVFNTLAGDRSERADQFHRFFLLVRCKIRIWSTVLRYIIKNFDDDVGIFHVRRLLHRSLVRKG